DDSLYRVVMEVGSNVVDPTAVPIARVRVSDVRFDRADVLTSNSQSTGAFSPTEGSKQVYAHYFPFAPERDTFRLFFDVLNLDGVDDPNATFSLFTVVMESLGTDSLGTGTEIGGFDFRNAQTNG